MDDIVVAINHSPAIAWIIDAESLRFHYCSARVQDVLGYSPDEMVDLSLSDLLAADLASAALAELGAHASAFDAHAEQAHRAGVPGGVFLAEVLPLLHRSGRVVWVEMEGSFFACEDGRICAAGLARDFTESHEEYLRLQQSEDRLEEVSQAWTEERERLRFILDSMSDAVMLFEAVRGEDDRVADFRLIDMNLATSNLSGVSREAATGKLLSELYPPAYNSFVFVRYAQSLEQERPVLRIPYRFDGSMPSLAGREFEIDVIPHGNMITASWHDVTEQNRAARALAESEERYRLLASNLTGIVVKINPDDTIEWVSPSLVHALGWAPEEWLHHKVTEFFHPDDLPVRNQIAEAAKRGESSVGRWRVSDSEGLFHWAQFMAGPYLDAEGHPDGLVGSLRIIDTEVAYERELERRARYDELSGLLNRRAILERVARVVGEDRRSGGPVSAVLFCDIDHLKEVNDAHGHAGGDALIVAVSQRMAAAIREEDSVGRIGGDEFLVLLDGLRSLEDAVRVAEKVRQAVHGPVVLPDGTVLDPSLSIGLAVAEPNEGVSRLVERANGGLYDAKHDGRDRVVLIAS